MPFDSFIKIKKALYNNSYFEDIYANKKRN